MDILLYVLFGVLLYVGAGLGVASVTSRVVYGRGPTLREKPMSGSGRSSWDEWYNNSRTRVVAAQQKARKQGVIAGAAWPIVPFAVFGLGCVWLFKNVLKPTTLRVIEFMTTPGAGSADLRRVKYEFESFEAEQLAESERRRAARMNVSAGSVPRSDVAATAQYYCAAYGCGGHDTTREFCHA